MSWKCSIVIVRLLLSFICNCLFLCRPLFFNTLPKSPSEPKGPIFTEYKNIYILLLLQIHVYTDNMLIITVDIVYFCLITDWMVSEYSLDVI